MCCFQNLKIVCSYFVIKIRIFFSRIKQMFKTMKSSLSTVFLKALSLKRYQDETKYFLNYKKIETFYFLLDFFVHPLPGCRIIFYFGFHCLIILKTLKTYILKSLKRRIDFWYVIIYIYLFFDADFLIEMC